MPRLHGLETAIGPARDSLVNNVYHDVHCWVFTPLSFAALLGRAARLGLHRFACAWLDETKPGCNEFLVCLTASSNAEATVASWRAIVHQLRKAQATLEDDRIIALREERDLCRAALAAAVTNSEVQAARIAALERSASWRLTAPLRAGMRLVRPRRRPS